ncbi:hypothetical protein [Paraburkholderia fungorum]|uniref:hypothetical protein n=1 Tax=Paraburkholderia fungorum TaxID=134537 RepID=UPI00241F7FD2|nr:hypothetical protein [Paraburkholderia fungorum]
MDIKPGIPGIIRAALLPLGQAASIAVPEIHRPATGYVQQEKLPTSTSAIIGLACEGNADQVHRSRLSCVIA